MRRNLEIIQEILDKYARQEGEECFEDLKIKWFSVVENSQYDKTTKQLLNQRISDMHKVAKIAAKRIVKSEKKEKCRK